MYKWVVKTLTGGKSVYYNRQFHGGKQPIFEYTCRKFIFSLQKHYKYQHGIIVLPKIKIA